MKNKINIALFVQSRNLSDEILKKIVKLKNKINIFLVVSDKNFSDKLKQNYKSKYNWIINNKNNEKKKSQGDIIEKKLRSINLISSYA